VIVAVPVGAKSSCEKLAHEVDRLVCAVVPETLDAVSVLYEEFGPTTDEEVMRLMELGQSLRD
jgi:predicted phosphoribosyltransferase